MRRREGWPEWEQAHEWGPCSRNADSESRQQQALAEIKRTRLSEGHTGKSGACCWQLGWAQAWRMGPVSHWTIFEIWWSFSFSRCEKCEAISGWFLNAHCNDKMTNPRASSASWGPITAHICPSAISALSAYFFFSWLIRHNEWAENMLLFFPVIESFLTSTLISKMEDNLSGWSHIFSCGFLAWSVSI